MRHPPLPKGGCLRMCMAVRRVTRVELGGATHDSSVGRDTRKVSHVVELRPLSRARLAGKGGHYLMCESTQRRRPARTVDQHIFCANVTQCLQLDGDIVGRAIEGAGLGELSYLV